MINVWILTVVISNGAGMTSFQVKFYSEKDASDAGKFYKKSLDGALFLSITINQTQEQKIN